MAALPACMGSGRPMQGPGPPGALCDRSIAALHNGKLQGARRLCSKPVPFERPPGGPGVGLAPGNRCAQSKRCTSRDAASPLLRCRPAAAAACRRAPLTRRCCCPCPLCSSTSIQRCLQHLGSCRRCSTAGSVAGLTGRLPSLVRRRLGRGAAPAPRSAGVQPSLQISRFSHGSELGARGEGCGGAVYFEGEGRSPGCRAAVRPCCCCAVAGDWSWAGAAGWAAPWG